MNNNLSTLSFKDMKLGLKKSFEIEITDSLVNSFAELSGDFNPLHTNKDYAISNGFENNCIIDTRFMRQDKYTF